MKKFFENRNLIHLKLLGWHLHWFHLLFLPAQGTSTQLSDQRCAYGSFSLRIEIAMTTVSFFSEHQVM